MIRMLLIPLLLLSSCALHEPGRRSGNLQLPTGDILYSSSDPSDIVVFSRRGTRFSPILNLTPPSATRYLEPSEGVQCVSIGIAGNSTDYAIKRPIKAGDRYQCLSTSFRVVRCLEECREAIVEVEERLVNNQSRLSTMLVSGCLGVLAFSHTEELTDGVPFDAWVLRGPVGVLADPTYPDCQKLSIRAFR